jgi:thymidylate kinase
VLKLLQNVTFYKHFDTIPSLFFLVDAVPAVSLRRLHRRRRSMMPVWRRQRWQHRSCYSSIDKTPNVSLHFT